MNSDTKDSDITKESLAESYCVDKLYGNTLPLTCQMINKYKCKEK